MTYKKKIIIFFSYYLRIRESCIKDEIIAFASSRFFMNHFKIKKICILMQKKFY